MLEDPVLVELRLPLEDGVRAELAEEQLGCPIQVEFARRCLKDELDIKILETKPHSFQHLTIEKQ